MPILFIWLDHLVFGVPTSLLPLSIKVQAHLLIHSSPLLQNL
jgi:hypothetical protein